MFFLREASVQECGKHGMFLSLMKKDICQRETSAVTIHACGFVCHMLSPQNNKNTGSYAHRQFYLNIFYTQTQVHINFAVLFDCASRGQLSWLDVCVGTRVFWGV